MMFTMWQEVVGLVVAVAALPLAAAQNPITNVVTNGNVFYYRDNITFSFEDSRIGSDVSLTLVAGATETACALLRYPFRISSQSGTNNVSLATPSCVPPANNYKIRVAVNPRVYTDSNAFEIQQSNALCEPGEFNANNGREPGCRQCPIGTFSSGSGSTSCTNCSVSRPGFTTSFRGASSVDDCSVVVVPPNQGFLKFDKTYFYHSNAGGTLLMAHEHKTLDECLQLCRMSPGCKAFDAGGTVGTFPFGGPPMPGNGNQEVFQAGDCFLSYDDIGTIKPGDVGMTNQLELFQKVDAQRVKDIFFRKSAGCYIRESNDGGAYKDEHSPEACSQLCLNDNSCVSFDSGIVAAGTGNQRWQTAIDDCFLSYKNSSEAGDDYICDNGATGLDYYERIIPQYLEIDMDFDNTFSWNRDFREEEPRTQAWQTWTTAEANFFTSYYNCQDNACRRALRRPGKPCPVTWSYEGTVGALYPFIGNRNDFAEAVRAQIIARLNIPANDAGKVFVRVEKSTGADGSPTNPAKTTAVINTGSAMYDARYNNLNIGQIQIQNQNYNVRKRDPVRCAAGHTSQSGYAPGCMECPPDSYANWPQTDCLPCPLGTVSDAGSSTTGEKACRPVPDTSEVRLGPFRVGYEWFGFYQAPLGEDGDGRMGRGQIRLRVTQAILGQDDFVDLQVYASIHHGEDCNTARGCRDPGVSEYFMTGSVNQNSVNLSPAGWGGITDRNTRLFSRGDITATVSYSDRNTIMSGTMYGNNQEGSVTLYERCHSADESGTFQPGNKFVGTYSCYRRGTDMSSPGFGNDPCVAAQEGNLPEKDIRRIEFLITSVNDGTGEIQGAVNFDHESGQAEYHVSGYYDDNSGKATFNAFGGAWNSPHPDTIPARQLSGRLSDDKEFFIAQFNENPNCRCNQPAFQGEGDSCSGSWTSIQEAGHPWCYVDQECPDARSHPTIENKYYAYCNLNQSDFSSPTNMFQTCTDVKLARVCSTGSPNCPVGWSSDPVQDRCMRLSNTFPDSPSLTWADANDFCAGYNASLVSLHSMTEQRFIFDPNFNNGLATNVQELWIGLNATQSEDRVIQEWTDGTHFGQFVPLAQRNTAGCGFLQNNRWLIDQTCSTRRSFACWRQPLGIAPDACECSGATDDDHHGGYCQFWSGRNSPSWCYVSDSCVTGVRAEGSDLRKANCFTGEEASTTTVPSTTAAVTVTPIGCDSISYQRMVNGVAQCAVCTTQFDCENGQYLDGECTTYTNPVCRDIPDGMFLDTTQNPPTLGLCDVRCNTCVSSDVGGCTSCRPGSPLYLESVPGIATGPCVSDCQNRGKYKDNATQTCVPCTDPGSDQRTEQQCSEYSDTRCVFPSGGCQRGKGAVQNGASGCCADCVTGFTYSTLIDGSQGYYCSNVQECLAGEQEDTPPIATADRTCEPCPVGTFSTSAGPCEPLTNCPAGTRVVEGADASLRPPFADRTCEPCPDNTYSTRANSAACQTAEPQFGCDAGSEEVSAPSPTSNRVCRVCSSGFFSDGVSPCAPYTDCSPGTFVRTTPSRLNDRQCGSCIPNVTFTTISNEDECRDVTATCDAGKGLSAPATVSSDIECRTCRFGQFNDGNSLECSLHSDCQPGTFSAAAGTTSNDRNCQICQLGTYSISINSNTCIQQRVCDAGWEPSNEPTPSTNRRCQRCVNGETSEGNNAPCVDPSLVRSGEDQDPAASSGDDDKSSSTLLIVIVVVVLVLIAAVIGAGVVIKKSKEKAAAGAFARTGFENPLYAEATGGGYDNGSKINPAFDSDKTYQEPDYDSNYQDPTFLPETETTGYMDIPAAGEDGTPGYMDVAPQVAESDDEDI